MKRHLLAAGALTLALATSTCGEDTGQFLVIQNQVPSPACEIPGTRTGVYQGEGTLDVALVEPSDTTAYFLFPLFQNNLRARGEEGAIEPNRLIMRAFEVDIELGDTPPAEIAALFNNLRTTPDGTRLLAYDEPWSGSIDPGGGTASAYLRAFPADLARQIRSTGVLARQAFLRVFVNMRMVAETSEGTVKSDAFRYPLLICEGCLVNNRGTCPAMPLNLGNPCNLAQDQFVDCCVGAAGLVCPATAAN